MTNNIEVSDSEEFFSELEIRNEVYMYLIKEGSLTLSDQYKDFQNVFDEHSDNALPSHREGLDYAIKLLPSMKLTFSSLYNLSQ